MHDWKSRVLFGVLLVAIGVSTWLTYDRYMVKRDYIVLAQGTCDPAEERCFVTTCDPELQVCLTEEGGETVYYKLLYKKAYNFPDCQLGSEECPPLRCEEGEEDCTEELCVEDDPDETYTCNDPATYVPEEEMTEEEGAEGEEAAEEGATSEEEAAEPAIEEAPAGATVPSGTPTTDDPAA